MGLAVIDWLVMGMDSSVSQFTGVSDAIGLTELSVASILQRHALDLVQKSRAARIEPSWTQGRRGFRVATLLFGRFEGRDPDLGG